MYYEKGLPIIFHVQLEEQENGKTRKSGKIFIFEDKISTHKREETRMSRHGNELMEE